MPGKKTKGAPRRERNPYKGKTKAKAKAAKARPRLSIGYKGVPNQYRFIRETRPTTIDLGNAATPGVTHIAGTGSIPNIAVFEFPNFAINQLAGGFTEFSALFANYKIDKIQTILIPQWSSQNVQAINPLTGTWLGTGAIPNLMLTRVNTKYLPNGYVVKATAEENRDQLAQIQKKTRSMYGSRKWLRINTVKPRVNYEIEDGAGGQNIVSQASPWLPSVDAADQEYSMNDILFADRLDGTNFAVGLHLYRMYHRIHFRTSFVG